MATQAETRPIGWIRRVVYALIMGINITGITAIVIRSVGDGHNHYLLQAGLAIPLVVLAAWYADRAIAWLSRIPGKP